ncbi:MAG: AraC family transcriptional regulator [Motiliproteus sp.]
MSTVEQPLLEKPHIANHYIRACIGGALRLGHNSDELLDAAQIPLHWIDRPERLITEQQTTRLVKTVWRATDDEFMGLAPEPCASGIFALMCEFCLHSETLGAMLKQSARFYRTVYNGLDIEFVEGCEEAKQQVFFRLHLHDGRYDSDHLLQEFLLLMWQRFNCWLVDQQIPFLTSQFSYPEPSHVEEYRAMFPGELSFDQATSGFSLHAKYLHLPIVRTETELQCFLQEAPAFILHRPSQDESLRAKIRQMLSRYDYADMPSLDQISQQLHMTPRSIGRKLKDEGTAFSKIRESLRREYAIKLLTTEHLSIADVSERTGFSETAAFCRAFKRWTGRPPSAWRQGRGSL